MGDYISSTVNYALGVFMGWLIWGRKLRYLRRAAEDHVRAVQQIIDGNKGA